MERQLDTECQTRRGFVFRMRYFWGGDSVAYLFTDGNDEPERET